MAKPVIHTVNDDPQVLRAIERDLRRRHAGEYRVLRADPAETTPETPGKPKLYDHPAVPCLVVQRMPLVSGVEWSADAQRVSCTDHPDVRPFDDAGLDVVRRIVAHPGGRVPVASESEDRRFTPESCPWES